MKHYLDRRNKPKPDQTLASEVLSGIEDDLAELVQQVREFPDEPILNLGDEILYKIVARTASIKDKEIEALIEAERARIFADIKMHTISTRPDPKASGWVKITLNYAREYWEALKATHTSNKEKADER